jgi:nematode chemoreceptor
MIVMRRPEFFQYSCYKLMFLLGVIDMIVLPFNSIASGIQCMLGYHYCNNPSLYFIIGAIPTCEFIKLKYIVDQHTVAEIKNRPPKKMIKYIISLNFLDGWYGAAMTCILLAINRLLEMLAPRIAKCLFKGRRIYIWLVLPILYMVFACFQASAVYNIKLFAFYFNPFTGEKGWEISKVEFFKFFK